ncbi:MAG TPA: SAM-dependent chlorinase/fluorinase, partial [Bryobacteraceae bacterium]|nr:SAM-dependent chlorinase/fluorinase [Bryobacteraceae bacterium]
GGHRFIAPDNGLLSFVLKAVPNASVREISDARFFRDTVSRTFHGRDIFAPVSAHVARGIVPKRFGNVINNTITQKFSAIFQEKSGRWRASVLKIDRFGNIISNLESEKCSRIASEPFEIRIAGRSLATFHANYAEARRGEIFALFGSSGFVEISLNQSDAAKRLRVKAGSPITLRMRGKPRTRTSVRSR